MIGLILALIIPTALIVTAAWSIAALFSTPPNDTPNR